jgi:hypothetical protein
MNALKGKTDRQGLTELLLKLEAAGRDGGLTLIKHEEIIILLLREGWIVGLECFPARIDTLLGNMLLLQDKITADDLLHARETGARGNDRIWKSLLDNQACEEGALRETMRQLAGHISFMLLQWGDTRYAFHPEPLPELKNAVLDPLTLSAFLEAGRSNQQAWQAIQEQLPPADAVLAPSAKGMKLRSTGDTGLKPQDLYVLERITGEWTVDKLARRSGLPPLWVADSLVRLQREGCVIHIKKTEDEVTDMPPAEPQGADEEEGVHLDPQLDGILTEMLGGDMAETELPRAIKMAFQCGDEDDLPELQLSEGISGDAAGEGRAPDLSAVIDGFMENNTHIISACLFSADGRLLAEVRSIPDEEKDCRRIANLVYSFLRRYPSPALNRVILDENDRTMMAARLAGDHFLLVAASKDIYLGAINIAVNKLIQLLTEKMAELQ